MPTYVCRVSTGHPAPSDPAIGCEHSDLGLAIQCAALRNSGCHPDQMRTYVATRDWSGGPPFPVSEISRAVQAKMHAPMMAIQEGRSCSQEAAAILVAMGMICLAPKQPS